MICPDADLSEIGLDKHIVDGRIKVIPDKDDEEGNGDQDSDMIQQEIEAYYLLFLFSTYFIFCIHHSWALCNELCPGFRGYY